MGSRHSISRVWLTAALCPLTTALFALTPIASTAATTADLEKLLRAQKIISPTMKVTSSQQGSTIVFAVFPDKDAKESTNTLKIRAVLMAKTIMTADKGVQRVDVQFHQKENAERYDEVVVRSVDVKAFGAGITTEEELLTSLQVSTKGGGSISQSTPTVSEVASSTPPANNSASSQTPTDVAPSEQAPSGAKSEERAKLTARVQNLKSQGVGVKPFLEQITAADEMAKNGDSPALAEKLEQLDSSIASQEKVLADRKKAAAAAAKAASTSAPAATPKSAAASTSGTAALSAGLGAGLGAGAGSDSNVYMRMFTGMMHHAASRLNVDPRLIPEDGPYYQLRWAMATLIKMHSEKGLGNGIMPMWMECQELAKTNNESQVAYKMRNIAAALKLPDPITHQDWYHAQAHAYNERMRHSSRPQAE